MSQIEIYRFIDSCAGKVPEILDAAVYTRTLGLDEISFLSQVMKINFIESCDPQTLPELEDLSHRVRFLDINDNSSVINSLLKR
jgi:hypothetical protein